MCCFLDLVNWDLSRELFWVVWVITVAITVHAPSLLSRPIPNIQKENTNTRASFTENLLELNNRIYLIPFDTRRYCFLYNTFVNKTPSINFSFLYRQHIRYCHLIFAYYVVCVCVSVKLQWNACNSTYFFSRQAFWNSSHSLRHFDLSLLFLSRQAFKGV